MTLDSFEKFIQNNLIAYNIRRVLLDIGWQNYSFGTIGYQRWVDDWMEACDDLGVQVVIFVGQLTPLGIGSRWVESVIASDPTTQTYYSNGTAAKFISYDNRDVAKFFVSDIARIYSFYGKHPSWVGIGTGYGLHDPYFNQNSTMLGYSGTSLVNFLNSRFYSSDVNSTGYLAGGILDPLWKEFKPNAQIVLSSGQWMTSSAVMVFEDRDNSNVVDMYFRLNRSLTSLTLLWYGNIVGKPGPLNLKVFPDDKGTPNKKILLANYTYPYYVFSPTTSWQELDSIAVSLKAGGYWVEFSAAGDSSNYYSIYVRDYPLGQPTSLVYSHSSSTKGSAILWVKDTSGKTVSLAPYQQVIISPRSSQTFYASKPFDFNTVMLFLSDREYNETQAKLYVLDATDSNRLVASGILSQNETHGLQNWTPIALNTTVHAQKGHSYTIEVVDPGSTYSWRVVLRGLFTDPASYGFQGQASYLLFMLCNFNFTQKFFDFTGIRSNGMDAVSPSYMDALRFIPAYNEKISEVDIMMFGNGQGNYSSGSMKASIYTSTPEGSRPLYELQSITVDAGNIPVNGLLRIKGFNLDLHAGEYYWVVFSANGTGSFSFMRLTSAYAYKVLVSLDGGRSWQQPREGPTDFSFIIKLSNETIGNFVEGSNVLSLGRSSIYAQSFTVTGRAAVSGVFLGPLKPGGHLLISINKDNTHNEPSLAPIATTIYDSSMITIPYGLQFITLNNTAYLDPGKYWITIQPLDVQYSISQIEFMEGKGPNVESLLSSDGGYSWKKISNNTSLLLFGLASQQVSAWPSRQTDIQYLMQYHRSSWIKFITSSEISLYSNLTVWLRVNSGRNFYFFTSIESPYVAQFNTEYLLNLMVSNPGTCQRLLEQLSSEFISSDSSYAELSNRTLAVQCKVSTILPMLSSLQFSISGMHYSHFSGTKVLVVADTLQPVSDYLSSAFNVSYTYTKNILSQNLSQYNSVVWLSSAEPFSNLTVSYMLSGGYMVFLSDKNFSYSSIPVTYQKYFKHAEGGFVSYVLSGTGINLYSARNLTLGTSVISRSQLFLSSVGKGYFAFISLGNKQIKQLSESFFLLSNFISHSGKIGIPYFVTNYGGGSFSFAVKKVSGSYLLLQIMNNSTEKGSLTMSLNLSYYGLKGEWYEFNASSLKVSAGTGKIATLKFYPSKYCIQNIYFVKKAPEGALIYSNVPIIRQLVYPNQAIYTLNGARGQNVLLVLNSHLKTYSVSTIGGGKLNGLNVTSSGNETTIRFISNGTEAVRVLFQEKSSVAQDELYPIFAYILAAAIVLDALFFSTYLLKRRK